MGTCCLRKRDGREVEDMDTIVCLALGAKKPSPYALFNSGRDQTRETCLARAYIEEGKIMFLYLYVFPQYLLNSLGDGVSISLLDIRNSIKC